MVGTSIHRAILLAVIALMLGHRVVGQEPKPEPSQASATPAVTFRVHTRMVTVDVVAKDRHGNVVPGLTAGDFQVFEQVAPIKEEWAQGIRGFMEVSPQAIATASKQPAAKMPPGVFSNLVTTRLVVPPTILLLDGINTEGDSGLQARRQMVKMLASIPPDTPVAVFLLGNDLLLLQSFTKDPKLLREAAQQVMTRPLDNGGLGVDPHDDPFSLSNQTLDMFGGDDEAPPSSVSAQAGRGTTGPLAPTGPPGGELQMAEIRRFETETFAADTDMRVHMALDALRAIARHVSGYPGKKNLLWISSSFPMVISPDQFDTHHIEFEGMRNYADAVAVATNALADAQVSVYPVNPAGVQTNSYYQASKAPVARGYGPPVYSAGRSLNREDLARFSGVESMTEVAKQTGGSICINDNDLGDCVRTAVEEGSSYYELAYYPNTGNWQGEFHHIIVKTKRPGLQLSYREGYFAGETGSSKEKSKAGNDEHLQEAACGDLLTATSVLVVGQALPPDSAKQAKYYLSVDPKMLTANDRGDGNREFRLDFAVCSFDRSGKALQYLQDSVIQPFAPAEYSAMRGFQHVIEFAPREGATRVRLVVRDSSTGNIGSVDVPYAAGAMAVPSTNGSATPPVTAPAHN